MMLREGIGQAVDLTMAKRAERCLRSVRGIVLTCFAMPYEQNDE